MTAGRRWTATDLRRIRREIDGYAVAKVVHFPSEIVTESIESARREIVLAGLRSFADRLERRATADLDTAEHYERNPRIHGASTPETVARFRGSAERSVRAARRIRKLLERVEREGLPEAVRGYLPSGFGKGDEG